MASASVDSHGRLFVDIAFRPCDLPSGCDHNGPYDKATCQVDTGHFGFLQLSEHQAEATMGSYRQQPLVEGTFHLADGSEKLLRVFESEVELAGARRVKIPTLIAGSTCYMGLGLLRGSHWSIIFRKGVCDFVLPPDWLEQHKPL